MRHFRNVAFQQPRIQDSDHWAIVTFIQKETLGKLKHYHESRQTFPLKLPPAEEQEAQTRLFGKLSMTTFHRTGKYGLLPASCVMTAWQEPPG
jgi:hypothetical protein